MGSINVAVVGLRLKGAVLLERLIRMGDLEMNIVCAVEPEDVPGRRRADACGIALVSLDDLVEFSADIDVIFDLRDTEGWDITLGLKLAAQGNHHTHVLTHQSLDLMNAWASHSLPQAA